MIYLLVAFALIAYFFLFLYLLHRQTKKNREKTSYEQGANQTHEAFRKVVKMKKHCLIFGNLFIWICALLNCLIYGQSATDWNTIYLAYLLFLLGENILLFIFMNYFLMDRPDNKNFWRSLFDRNQLANSHSSFMRLPKVERIVFILNIIFSFLSILLLILHLPNASWSDSSWSWHYVRNVSWIFKTQLFMVSATCLMGYAYKYFIDEERQ